MHYFAGDYYQLNLTGSNFASPCVLATVVCHVDFDLFRSWNTGLGNVPSPSCAFNAGVRYYGSLHPQKPDQLDERPSKTTTTITITTTLATICGSKCLGHLRDECSECMELIAAVVHYAFDCYWVEDGLWLHIISLAPARS